MLEFEIENQSINGRIGQKIVAYYDNDLVGRTGYLSFNPRYPPEEGKLATMGVVVFRDGKKIGASDGILVEQSYRKRKIGKALLTELVQEASRDYEKLMIYYGVPESKGFYEKVLTELKEDGKIKDFKKIIISDEEGFYDYTIILNPA
jgi:GNAT superfamily N-acetyltransferase